MLERVSRAGLDIFTSRQLEERGFIVVFSDRRGGVSTGDYAALNLSYNVGDDAAAVRSNRKLLAEAVGIPVKNWVLPKQVHGCNVATIDALKIGRGSMDFSSGIPSTDGLFTAIKDVALAVLTADCIPIVFVAPQRSAVAVAHAGWRGVLNGVASVTVSRLAAFCGCSADEILAFVGPHIRSCCMEVDEPVAVLFEKRFNGAVAGTSTQGKSRLDLEVACSQQLNTAGLLQRNIFSAGVCTACDPGYFSYRGSGGKCGRQGAIAAVLDGAGGS
jgi:purine-nucleoside/S-methyl-5'-thioadenosine phosphorylase / adenosine deaminase